MFSEENKKRIGRARAENKLQFIKYNNYYRALLFCWSVGLKQCKVRLLQRQSERLNHSRKWSNRSY